MVYWISGKDRRFCLSDAIGVFLPHRVPIIGRRRFVILLAGIMLGPLAYPQPALATMDAASLQALADKFVDKIGGGMEQADAALKGKTTRDLEQEAYFDNLTDAELLILEASLSERQNRKKTRFSFDIPLSGIKQGRSLMVSLIDFAALVGFAFKVDGDAGTANGWFMAPENTFALDGKNLTATVGTQTLTLKPDDIRLENNEIYVRHQLLESWFGLTLVINLQGQKIEVVSDQPLPMQTKISRKKKRDKGTTENPPEKPRLSEKDKVFTLPRADVSLVQRSEKRNNGTITENTSEYTIHTANQIAGLETTAFLSGNTQEPLERARVKFRKESDKTDLLGPLKARVVEFNDINTVTVPSTGSAGLERGVRVSNRSERYSVDTETVIDGDAQPGWDVELYRNESYVDGITVGVDGRYIFENVSLFAGDNRFKIILYGPLGEVQEEERLITVAPNLVGNLKGYYNLSLSQKGEITYEADDKKSRDDGTVRLAGTYDRKMGDNLTLRSGIHSRQTAGQRDNYFYTGAVTTKNKVIYNADLVTTSDGPFEVRGTARRQLNRHNLSGYIAYASENYSDLYIDEDTAQRPALYELVGTASGPFVPTILDKVVYNANAGYTLTSDDITTLSSTLQLSSSLNGIRYNNRFYAQQRLYGSGPLDDTRTLQYDISASGRYRQYQWRTALAYEFEPLGDFTDFDLRLRRTFTPKISGDVGLRHFFEREVSTADASLTYNGDKARFTPSISYDSDSNMIAQLRVNFSIAPDPHTGNIAVTGRSVTNQGGLSVFAFLDKGADGVFSEGDEALQDVVIKLVQLNKDLITDDKGEAFAYDLSTNKVTDVIMEESSAFDPTWVSGFDGVSFRPRAGDVTRLEFPVLRGAEIDGTASILEPNGSLNAARGMTLRLVTPDGVVTRETSAPYDGFYIIGTIKPGVYYLTTDAAQAPSDAYRVPEQIVITPEGGTLYGKDITLTKGYNIPFTFTATNANPAEARRTKVLRPEDIAGQDVFLRLGDYNSTLAMTLKWYKFKLATRGWSTTFTPLVDDFDAITPDAKTGKRPLVLQPSQPLRMEEAAKLCERLIDAGFACGVDVHTTYALPTATEAKAAAPAKKG